MTARVHWRGCRSRRVAVDPRGIRYCRLCGAILVIRAGLCKVPLWTSADQYETLAHKLPTNCPHAKTQACPSSDPQAIGETLVRTTSDARTPGTGPGVIEPTARPIR